MKYLELCLHLQIFSPGKAASFSLDNQNWFLSQTGRIGYQILRVLHRALCLTPEAAALGTLELTASGKGVRLLKLHGGDS